MSTNISAAAGNEHSFRRSRSFTVLLDQCAISELALSEDPLLKRVRGALETGAEAGNLICPVCPETMVETAACDRSRRLAIHRLQCSLAGDPTGGEVLFFKSLWQLIEEETLAMAQSLPPPVPVQLSSWHGIEQDFFEMSQPGGLSL
jgi:hypothetical protein